MLSVSVSSKCETGIELIILEQNLNLLIIVPIQVATFDLFVI